MVGSGAVSASPSRLTKLLGFLEADPTNAQLLSDAAATALDDGQLETARDLIDRLESIGALSPDQLNLKGLIALAGQEFEQAVQIYSLLCEVVPGDPALSFNLAWANAMLGRHEAVVAGLDSAATKALPQAAALKVQSLHTLGRLDEAIETGRSLAMDHPESAALMAALSVAALDGEDLDLAQTCARKAGESHEGLSTLGMLELDQGEVDQSLRHFERALAVRPDSARGQLGMGLGLMASGSSAAAAPFLDRGAEIFGDHLGSWVAAGWAYFTAGDYQTSRARFEKALTLDDTFAETHGGLAVLDIVGGDMESARRRTEIALRLDRKCLSAALAKSLILASEGDSASAERIQQIALNMPLGANGDTIAKAALRFGRAPGNKD